jgi:hypothetical protein
MASFPKVRDWFLRWLYFLSLCSFCMYTVGTGFIVKMCCVVYLIVEVSCLWHVAVGFSQLSSISYFFKFRSFEVLDVSICIRPYVERRNGGTRWCESSLSSWAFGEIWSVSLRVIHVHLVSSHIFRYRLLLLLIITFHYAVLLKSKVYPTRSWRFRVWVELYVNYFL